MGPHPLELAAVTGFATCLTAVLARIVAAAGDAGDWFCIGVAVPLGVVLADFASGVFHWAGDTLGDADTPLLGPRFIAPFREHHVDPLGITTHGFFATNGNTAVGALPFVVALWLGVPAPRGASLFVASVAASACAFGFATNQFHKWAHATRVPRIVSWLQRAGLILSPARHDLHHTPPFDQHYCITVGWLGAPLAYVGFFRTLERVVAAMSPKLLTRPAPVRDRAA